MTVTPSTPIAPAELQRARSILSEIVGAYDAKVVGQQGLRTTLLAALVSWRTLKHA